jgi:PAS domain S-box-containing protein
MRSRSGKVLGAAVVLTGVYFAAGKVGLLLAFVHASATAVWPPTGIALAAFLLVGYRVWPAIFLGAFLVNISTAGTVATSVGIATGNTLEGLAGAYLVNRFANGRNAFERPRDALAFALLAGMVGTVVSPTLGVVSLSVGGFARWTDFGRIWLTWWLGDASAALIVAPVLLLWGVRPLVRWDRRLLEAAVLLACLLAAGGIVFGGWLLGRFGQYPIEFLCMPFLVWIAFRIGQRETATGAFLLSAMAIWGTLHGIGPFAHGTPQESLLLLQAFMGVTAVMGMVLAAAVAEARRGEEAQARLASIVASSGDAVIGKTLDGTIVSWNGGARRLYGYAPSEMIGCPVSVLAPSDRQDEVPEILERVRRAGQVEHLETLRVRKDGSLVAVSLNVSPITDAAGKILGISTIARDVTERQRAEEVAREARALLSVKQLANAAAHEINNPLTTIVVHLQLLLEERKSDARIAERIKQALESVWRIRDIVDRMQHVTRLDLSEQSPTLPEQLDLRSSAGARTTRRRAG